MQTHLLIVDDEADLTSLFKGFFESVGYRVTVAHDGAQALELDENDPADAVITDLTMPKMNGEELTAQLRRRRSALPVIMMSGYGGDKDIGDGQTVVVVKPVSLMSLKQRLEKMLSEKG
jgi:CheY-like chemotaxis protein